MLFLRKRKKTMMVDVRRSLRHSKDEGKDLSWGQQRGGTKEAGRLSLVCWGWDWHLLCLGLECWTDAHSLGPGQPRRCCQGSHLGLTLPVELAVSFSVSVGLKSTSELLEIEHSVKELILLSQWG